MESGFATLLEGKRVLLALATRKEALPALGDVLERRGLHTEPTGQWEEMEIGPHASVVITGVGKANAAGAVASVLDPARHSGVVCVGIAGALPGSGLALGEIVHATTCVFADEGVETPDRFIELAELGFPFGNFEGPGVPTTPAWRAALKGALGGREGPIASVSTCSGTDERAHAITTRTHALAEGMEGAGAALVAHRTGVARAEIRVISNTTGDRSKQRWEMPNALRRLADVIGFFADARK